LQGFRQPTSADDIRAVSSAEEQPAYNRQVTGSSPVPPTRNHALAQPSCLRKRRNRGKRHDAGTSRQLQDPHKIPQPRRGRAERVDTFTLSDKSFGLPVMGTFEVRNGKINAWRDYFDTNQFISQMGDHPLQVERRREA
jgi:limonene-1,2-epoxide hydrolase catalytic subunit